VIAVALGVMVIRQEILENNWGDRAWSLQCKAEIRFYDPLSHWECYVLAVNPADHDEIYAIVNGYQPMAGAWSLKAILACYNANGDHPSIDREFVPRDAFILFKQLRERSYDTSRD